MKERNRLPFTTFAMPIERIRRGYHTAVYFLRSKRILEKRGNGRKGLMQVFNKVDGAIICGLDEALAILRVGTGYWRDYNAMCPLFDQLLELERSIRAYGIQHNWSGLELLIKERFDLQTKLDQLWIDCHNELTIHALQDGQTSPAYDAVLTVEGQASHFLHLESLYLGVLARATKVATNTHKVVAAAQGKPVLFFADRFDRWSNQTADGYAALKAGAFGVAADSMGEWWGVRGSGTTPHALIAMYNGDTAQATLDFNNDYPQVNTIALVDFHNDCVKTSLEVARAFAEASRKLWGVRLDTSGTIVDRSVVGQMGQFKPTGVCAQLVENVRNALDHAGFNQVKIMVSGGFDPERISAFEQASVPVDAYGVGSSLLQGNYDFTADIVQVDGQPMAKVGRQYRPGAGLKTFNWSEIEP